MELTKIINWFLIIAGAVIIFLFPILSTGGVIGAVDSQTRILGVLGGFMVLTGLVFEVIHVRMKDRK